MAHNEFLKHLNNRDLNQEKHIKDIAEILNEPEPPFFERLRQADKQRQIEEAEKYGVIGDLRRL